MLCNPKTESGTNILRDVNINNNKFNGTLPDAFYELTNLVYFIADNNQFTGELKPEIGNMLKLSWISLRENKMSSQFPHRNFWITLVWKTLRLRTSHCVVGIDFML